MNCELQISNPKTSLWAATSACPELVEGSGAGLPVCLPEVSVAFAHGGDQRFEFRSTELTSDAELFRVMMYPNPGNVLVNFEFDNGLNSTEDLELVVYDLFGRLISKQSIFSYEQQVTLVTDTWASGMYTYTVTSGDKLLNTGTFEIAH